MEPPLKRPRLSMFADEPENHELDRARIQNDLLLKNRFEAIFAKYSNDFSNIGDEIDLNTGNIIVNNGHLATMDGEKDTGNPLQRSTSPRDGQSVANGKSMLRAMTVAPDREDSFFEDELAGDVIQSIEAIAGVITISSDDEPSTDDPEADGYNTPMEEDVMHSTPAPSSLQPRTDSDDGDASDTDSLFEIKQDYRASSPDSLFAVEDPPVENPPVQIDVAVTAEEQEIITKFGTGVGREVLKLLADRDRAEPHIEPAWRIPVKIPEQPRSSLPRMDGMVEQMMEVANSTESSNTPDLPDYTETTQKATPSPNKGKSLWKGPARRTQTQIRQDEMWQRVREESEDPLQDGFNEAEKSALEEDSDEEADVDRCSRILKRGICPWCKEQYANRQRALQHLKRVITKHENGQPYLVYHNVEHIIRVRPKIMLRDKITGRGTRPARLLICDFKSLVELHEAGGYSIDYILREKLLHTTKQNRDQVRVLYEKYRTVDDDDGDTYTEAWTKKEKEKIIQLASRSMGTMDTIRIRMKTRSDKEIGDFLADIWLRECRSHRGIKTEILDLGYESDDLFSTVKRPLSDEDDDITGGSDQGSADDLFISQFFPASGRGTNIKREIEDSDVDELFIADAQ